MNVYSLIVIIACCLCEYTSVDMMPESRMNILKFRYGINFKYEGMLSHSSDRSYVAMKFDLLMVEDLKFSTFEFNSL